MPNKNHLLGGFAALTLATVMSGCGSSEMSAMPDVTDSRLDVALSDIERAGFDDEVEVIGGGIFGVVDESNWQVCDQEPAAGASIDSAPRLTVDRVCETEDSLEGDSSAADEVSEPTEKPVAQKPRGEARVSGGRPAGRETFVVPPMVGMNLQDAQDLLQSLGSYILTQTDATGWARFQMLDSNWKVCWQKPAPGTEVPLSRLIDLGAVKLDERCP